jgi:hypothetical protein
VRSLIGLTALLAAVPALAADVVYVSVAGEKRIAICQIDSSDGRLTHVGHAFTTGEPGALTTDPKRRFLFAALRSTGCDSLEGLGNRFVQREMIRSHLGADFFQNRLGIVLLEIG